LRLGPNDNHPSIIEIIYESTGYKIVDADGEINVEDIAPNDEFYGPLIPPI